MNDFAEKHPILTSTLSGLAAGGGAAALSALLADILEAKRQRDQEKKRGTKTTDEDSVVLRLRKKGELTDASSIGSDLLSTDTDDTPVTVEPGVATQDIKYNPTWSQPRTEDGRYSSFSKAAGLKRVFENAERIAGVAVALPAGYFLVNALHKKLEENRLKHQIAAAQQEYIDLLDGKQVKGAEAFIDTFLFDANLEKTAADSHGPASKPTTSALGRLVQKAYDHAGKATEAGGNAASFILASLLLTGGASAWLTHKVLSNKFDKKHDDDEEYTRPTRVIFKAGSFEAPLTQDMFIGTISVMRELMKPQLLSKSAQTQAPSSEDTKAIRMLMRVFDINTPENARKFQSDVLNDKLSIANRIKSWFAGRDALKNAIQGLQQKYGNDGLAYAVQYVQGQDAKNSNTPLSDDYLMQALYSQLGDTYGVKNPYNQDPSMLGYLAGYTGGGRDAIMKHIKDNPEQWFKVFGSEGLSNLRQGAINDYYNNLKKSDKGWGYWYNIPILGPILESISRLFANSSFGQRRVAREFLKRTDMSDNAIDTYLNDYDFSSNGWTKKVPSTGTANITTAPASAPANTPTSESSGSDLSTRLLKSASADDPKLRLDREKRAQVIDSLADKINFLANVKVLNDVTNDMLLAKLDGTGSSDGKNTSDRRKRQKQLAVLFSGDLNNKLSEEEKLRLIKLTREISNKIRK